jgi:hypothetical protein
MKIYELSKITLNKYHHPKLPLRIVMETVITCKSNIALMYEH